MSERFTVHLNDLHPTTGNTLAEAKGTIGIPIEGCIVANGCFDVLHPGHLSLLATLDTLAYQMRLRPVVALNSDESVRKLKGPGRPLVPQQSRSALINNLKWPFTVVIFDEETPQRLMDLLKPVAVVKGSEYPTESVIRWKESRVITVDMVPHWSTTSIVGNTR
jgi:rfaE bifunctional protein nucleotidyltransferase chain/domain